MLGQHHTYADASKHASEKCPAVIVKYSSMLRVDDAAG